MTYNIQQKPPTIRELSVVKYAEILRKPLVFTLFQMFTVRASR